MFVIVTRTLAAAAMVMKAKSMLKERKYRTCCRKASALRCHVALIDRIKSQVRTANATMAMSETSFGRVPMSVEIVLLRHATSRIRTGSRVSSASARKVFPVRFNGTNLLHLVNVCPPTAAF